MKLHKTRETGIYYYYNSNKEKLYMYRHKYTDDTGRRREKKKSSFKTEKAALQALLEVKAAMLRGETKSIEYDSITVAELLDIWFNDNKDNWKDTTLSSYTYIVNNYLKPMLGHYKLQKLNRPIYQREFINKLNKTHKPSTVKSYHRVFKIAINYAIAEDIIIKSKIDKITLKEDEVLKKNYLTPGELKDLLDFALETEHLLYHTIILLLAYTGMRRGELCGLKWKNIDFEKNTITIERTRDTLGTRTPKTKNSYRTILVDESIIFHLRKYRTWYKRTMLQYGIPFDQDNLVIVSKKGDPIPIVTITNMFKRVQKKSGLVDESGNPKITLHGLRHTHATILLNNNLHAKVIAERLGNTPEMIYNIYGHILLELEKKSVDVFSSALVAVGAKSGAN